MTSRDEEILRSLRSATGETRWLTMTRRMPQLGPLAEEPDHRFRCSIPGMFGGTYYEWTDSERPDELLVNFSSRIDWGCGTFFVVNPRDVREIDFQTARRLERNGENR